MAKPRIDSGGTLRGLAAFVWDWNACHLVVESKGKGTKHIICNLKPHHQMISFSVINLHLPWYLVLPDYYFSWPVRACVRVCARACVRTCVWVCVYGNGRFLHACPQWLWYQRSWRPRLIVLYDFWLVALWLGVCRAWQSIFVVSYWLHSPRVACFKIQGYFIVSSAKT